MNATFNSIQDQRVVDIEGPCNDDVNAFNSIQDQRDVETDIIANRKATFNSIQDQLVSEKKEIY